ncbi:MAG: ribosomal-processing cysteine protease Prp [Ruminococcaceae bacterium]|nr:ribosomal-processing cysteine protease Prp [Oscillospiraceae bacterium]
MIHIYYAYEGKYHILRITGHAGYAPRGQDIVCAGVSAVTHALLAYMRELRAVKKACGQSGELELLCHGCDETHAAFDMALAGYEAIAKAYPQHVEVDIPPERKGEEEHGPAFDLQLFGDGAAAAGAGTGRAETTAGAGSSRRLTTGATQTPGGTETAQPPAAGEAKSSDAADKRKAFRALIEGEYKEQYTELFQNAFNRRFREAKGMESRLKAQKPVLELLAQRYNVQPDDMAGLRSAMEADESYWRAAAEKAGMSVEQYRQFEKLRQDSRQLQQLRQRQRAGQQLTGWLREASAVRNQYPAFDFQAELADGNFRQLLRSGVGVQQAYELRHMEEIKAAAARQAAQSAGEQMAARIQSRSVRPRENGISTQSAAVTGSDVRSLTPAQRREIARRVQRGDKIRF